MGQPLLIKHDIGFRVGARTDEVRVALCAQRPECQLCAGHGRGFQNGKIMPPQSGMFQQFIGSGGSANWSRDGKSLAYSVCQPQAGCAIAIASPDTGQVRQIPSEDVLPWWASWSADGQSFLTDGTDLKGTRALYRINARTGEISSSMSVLEQSCSSHLMRRRSITAWGEASSNGTWRPTAERELFHERAKGNSVSIKVSPDGRHIAASKPPSTTTRSTLIPVSGGAPRELLGAERENGSTDSDSNGYRTIWRRYPMRT